MDAHTIPKVPKQNRSLNGIGFLGSLLFFSLSSLVFFAALYGILPKLQNDYSWFQIFNITLVAPMALLLIAAFVALSVENIPLTIKEIGKRFRLSKMDKSTWLWSVALAVFMFGGELSLPLSFIFALIAITLNKDADKHDRLRLAGGVLVFLVISWSIWQTNALFSQIQLHESPSYVKNFFAQFTPDAFMGIPLKGAWWLIPYYLVVLLVFNIGGEELWWRGYLLPRQELSFGKYAWLIHGILWACFHLFFQWTLYDLVRMLPTCCALSYVAQHTKNTWPAIIGHTAGNSGILIQIIKGAAGVN